MLAGHRAPPEFVASVRPGFRCLARRLRVIAWLVPGLALRLAGVARWVDLLALGVQPNASQVALVSNNNNDDGITIRYHGIISEKICLSSTGILAIYYNLRCISSQP